MSIIPSPHTFTSKQLRTAWREGLFRSSSLPGQTDARWQSETVFCNDYSLDDRGQPRNAEHREQPLKDLRKGLQGLVVDPTDHFYAIDTELSKHFVFCPRVSNLDPAFDENQAVQAALQLISRLPAIPPEINFEYHARGSQSSIFEHLKSYYLCESSRIETAGSISPWAELLVVAQVSTVVVRLALLVVTTNYDEFNVGCSISRFLDLISELIQTNDKVIKATDADAVTEVFILQAFLWVNWQRCLMLFFWFVLRSQLRHGYSKTGNEMLALRGCSLLLHPSTTATLHGYSS